jgi:hypothetical protein
VDKNREDRGKKEKWKRRRKSKEKVKETK